MKFLNNEIGKFIVIEGLDGSGKTTFAECLYRGIKQEITEKVVYTKEPANLDLSRFIKYSPDNIKDKKELQIKWLEDDRYFHITYFIKPLIEQGFYVICDRYFYSTVVYQEQELDTFSNYLQPDKLFFINTDFNICLSRRKNTDEEIEQENKLKLHYERYINLFNNMNKENYFEIKNNEIDLSEILNYIKG